MKNYNYLGILCFLFLMSCSTDSDSEQDAMQTPQEPPTTSISDAAFEQALIDLNFDEELDGVVLNSRIEIITNLTLDEKGISDLSGIENFRDLENLNVRRNNLNSVNVSSNKKLKFIWCEDNTINELNLDGLAILEKVGADRNSLSNIDVSSNRALQLLTLSENNLNSIDVSMNTELTDFIITVNPLDCIRVNQTQLDETPTDWSKDESDAYALDCE